MIWTFEKKNWINTQFSIEVNPWRHQFYFRTLGDWSSKTHVVLSVNQLNNFYGKESLAAQVPFSRVKESPHSFPLSFC